jgi:hypothetical protein
MSKLTLDLFDAMIGGRARHSGRKRQRWKWSRRLQKSDCFVDCAAVFNHLQRARFGDESGVKARIFAGEIDLANHGSGENVFRGGIFSGETEVE